MKKSYKFISFSVLAAVILLLSACGADMPNVNDNMDLPPINTNASNNQSSDSSKKLDYSDPVAESNPSSSEEASQESMEKDSEVFKVVPPAQQVKLYSQYSGAIIKTNLGDITVEFYADKSPVTVNNFMNLTQANFYDGTIFHRVIKDFMIQAGDPNSKSKDWSTHGFGGPGYAFADEINDNKLVAGSLAMANSGANTNGSQFFIVTATATPWLDGAHTNFGKVVSGMDVVRKIEATNVGANDHPLEDMVIKDIVLIK